MTLNLNPTLQSQLAELASELNTQTTSPAGQAPLFPTALPNSFPAGLPGLDPGSSAGGQPGSLPDFSGGSLPGPSAGLDNANWDSGTVGAEFDWQAASIGNIDYSDSGNWGSVSAHGYTHLLEVQGQVSGEAGFHDSTLTAGGSVEGRAELVDSHYDAEYQSPSIDVLGQQFGSDTQVQADAQAGVNGFADADLGVGKNTHVDLGAGGFDGASASVAGSETVGNIASVSGDARAWTGVGAKCDFSAGINDGKFSFNFGAGLCLGIGAEYDWGFTIDFGAIASDLENMASKALDVLGDAGGAVEDAATAVGDAASSAVNAVGDAASSAVNAVGNAASSAVNAVGDAASSAADAVGDAASSVGDAISSIF